MTRQWQPIETAPRDGTHLLLTDGVHLAAGRREFMIEKDWKYRGYVDGQITEAFTERIPNPDAGKRHEWWGLFGCSGFKSNADVWDYDGPVSFEPTHWMPLPAPPLPTSAYSETR